MPPRARGLSVELLVGTGVLLAARLCCFGSP
jgi:hypothetical protein